MIHLPQIAPTDPASVERRIDDHDVWSPIMPPPTQGRWWAVVGVGHIVWLSIMPPPTPRKLLRIVGGDQGRWGIIKSVINRTIFDPNPRFAVFEDKYQDY
ncbi:MAG: hypothetical protein U9N73_06830 [Candidatus Auribacterota bacterium]|nr:hypothetical protein [Candidatus Auribacterota bacterium]